MQRLPVTAICSELMAALPVLGAPELRLDAVTAISLVERKNTSESLLLPFAPTFLLPTPCSGPAPAGGRPRRRRVLTSTRTAEQKPTELDVHTLRVTTTPLHSSLSTRPINAVTHPSVDACLQGVTLTTTRPLTMPVTTSATEQPVP